MLSNKTFNASTTSLDPIFPQHLQRNLRSGCPFMSACGSEITKDALRQTTRVLSISIIANNDDYLMPGNARDKDPWHPMDRRKKNGDLNADCSYYDEDDITGPLRAPGYVWLITNDMDTNLAASDCTYDRIIVTKACLEDYDGNSGVFLFDQEFGLTYEQAKEISDHYPVWSEYYTDRDKDRTQALPCALLLLDNSREEKKP